MPRDARSDDRDRRHRLRLRDVHDGGTDVAPNGWNGLQVAIDGAEVVIAHARERLPRHWGAGKDSALAEARHELVLGQLAESPSLGIARDVRWRPCVRRIVRLREAVGAAEAWTGERPNHLAAFGVTRPAERDRFDEVPS